MATLTAPPEQAVRAQLASPGQPPEAAAEHLSAWWYGGYLAAIAVAELLTAFGRVELGIALHISLLFALPLHANFAAPTSQPFLIALALAPLIRVVSLAMPLAGLSPVNQYLLTSLPMFVAVLAAMHVLGLSRRAVGLRLGRVPLQLAIGLLGLPIGALVFVLLQPAPVVTELSWRSALVPVLVFLVSIGFLEEIIFRGILQSVARRTLGTGALGYVSALFAAFHIGYLSPPHAGFVFIVGLVFAWLVARTGSILGVTLAHGLTNIVVYLVFPLLALQGGLGLSAPTLIGLTQSAGGIPASATSVPASVGALKPVGPTPVSRQAQVAGGPGGAADAPRAAPVPPTGVSTTLPPTAVPTDAAQASSTSAQSSSQAAAPAPPVRATVPPPAVAVPTEAAPVRVVGADDVNVRTGPSTSADVVTRVVDDAPLEVAGPDRDAEGRTWRNVRLADGRTGWVASTLVGTAPAPTVAGTAVAASDTVVQATSVPSPDAPVASVPAAPTAEPVAALPGPAETIVRFYDHLERGDFETVVSLWSERMRALVPSDPRQLRARPAAQELTVRRAELISVDEQAGRAVVAVEVLELVDQSTGLQRRYVGTWNLVQGPSGWLLDQPNLRIE